MSSRQPRKQRKALYNAPHHQARKHIASHLAEELLLKYNRRSITLVAGDEVKIMRGDHKGKNGKVVDVDVTRRRVTVDGVTHKKADGTDVAFPLQPSNLLIVKLNLEDARRRAKLGESEAAAEKKPAKKGAKKAPEAKAAEAAAAKPRKAEAKQEKPLEAMS